MQDRIQGFREGLAGGGHVEPDAVHTGEFTRDGGFRAMTALLSGGAQVDCVFAVDDVMAVGAIAALRRHGRVGDPIGIAGFDDIATLRDIEPALTTVRFPLEEIGEAAMQMVLQPRADKPRRRFIGGAVVLRDSTACV